jgi:hypothetical protein
MYWERKKCVELNRLMGRRNDPSWVGSNVIPRNTMIKLGIIPRQTMVILRGSPRVVTIHGMNVRIYRELFTWLENGEESSKLNLNNKDI